MADMGHTHVMAFDSETAEQAVFKCTRCKRKIGYFKPETGKHPQARGNAGKWEPGEGIALTLGQICDAKD